MFVQAGRYDDDLPKPVYTVFPLFREAKSVDKNTITYKDIALQRFNDFPDEAIKTLIT
jgi:hypothetical protein